MFWLDLVCGPPPIEGPSSIWADVASRTVRIRWMAVSLGLVLIGAIVLTLATGWWALVVIPVYLVGVAATALFSTSSGLGVGTRMLVAVGLPTVSMGLFVGLLKLVGLL